MDKYIELGYDKLNERLNKIIVLWEQFLQRAYKNYVKSDFKDKELSISTLYRVNLFGLREVFERTHQREDYFYRYHNELKMSNFKEIGLIAFWIAKLKPFRLNENVLGEAYSLRINEEFALFFVFNSISIYAEKHEEKVDLHMINKDLYNEILYTMQYRDLSKEAYGCLVELIYIAMKNT